MKTALAYAAASAYCVLFDRLYALFGHGVYSGWMSLMFLYPLAGSALVFALLWAFMPAADATPHYRMFYNLYNSGIATLTLGGLLRGIFEIAGTSSPYTLLYGLTGGVLATVGAAGFWVSAVRSAPGRAPAPCAARLSCPAGDAQPQIAAEPARGGLRHG